MTFNDFKLSAMTIEADAVLAFHKARNMDDLESARRDFLSAGHGKIVALRRLIATMPGDNYDAHYLMGHVRSQCEAAFADALNQVRERRHTIPTPLLPS